TIARIADTHYNRQLAEVMKRIRITAGAVLSLANPFRGSPEMKKIAAFAAITLLSATTAYADGPRGSLSANVATRGSVINSATITQNSGAFAFAQITQGERASFDAPRYDPLIVVEPGSFIMPFVGITGSGNDN